MGEIGIDISGNRTQKVFDLFREARRFSYVISVCDEASAERCPVFPGVWQRLTWSFPDPSSLEGTYEERLETTRRIRDAIRERIQSWCNEVCPALREEATA